MQPIKICPLCASEHTDHYHTDSKRTFYQCKICDLVFVAPSQLPDSHAEFREYELHQNTLDDPGYSDF